MDHTSTQWQHDLLATYRPRSGSATPTPRLNLGLHMRAVLSSLTASSIPALLMPPDRSKGRGCCSSGSIFWKQDRVKVVVTEGAGFGVVATAKMNTGTSVMEGVVEPNVEEECVLVEPEGSLYGPASLLNAACHDCSSVAFEKRDQIWTAKCQKTNQTRGRVACRIHTKCAGINCMPSVRVPAMWRRSREFYSQTHGKTFN